MYFCLTDLFLSFAHFGFHFWFLLFFLGFVLFCLKKREHEAGLVGRWGRCGRAGKGKENNKKIWYEKQTKPPPWELWADPTGNAPNNLRLLVAETGESSLRRRIGRPGNLPFARRDLVQTTPG